MELNGWSSRALVNWGRAMCVRAELAYDADTAAAVQSGLPDWQQQQQRGGGGSGSASGTGIAEQLYQKAIDKFEAVLEAEPDKTAVKVGWQDMLNGNLEFADSWFGRVADLFHAACVMYLSQVHSNLGFFHNPTAVVASPVSCAPLLFGEKPPSQYLHALTNSPP